MAQPGVADKEIGDHVVDDVVDIDILGKIRALRTIRVPALDTLIGGVSLQALAGQVKHRVPGLGIAVGGGAVGVGIPVLLLAPEVGG